MSNEIAPEMISTALRNEIQMELFLTKRDLWIGPDIWDGESKSAYNNIISSLEQDINKLITMLRGL